MENNGSGSIIQDSSAFDSLIGVTIANNFRLVKRIGSGAMGRVYQAEQLSLGKMVAIKILRHELMADEKLLRRFELEARTASAVSHPNLVETFDCGRDKVHDLAYIAMELLQGPDLSQVIAREAPITLQRIARIMDQVLAALEEAHAQGIVHRDLKPGNIMLVPRRDEPDFVKVCDFGIAKVKNLRSTRPSLTMAGFVFGTPEYMSPEQACGAEVDARTDLYAVAAILYYLVSGELPFPAPSSTEVLARILRDEPERPSVRGYVNIPRPIEDLIMRGLEKNPDKRPQTASEFRVLLRDAWDGIIDYWPGQGNGPPTVSLRAATPPTPMPKVTTRDRLAPIMPTSPGVLVARGRSSGAPAVPRRSQVINWAVLRRRRPTRAATMGFAFAVVCGGVMLLILNRGRPGAPVPAPVPLVHVDAWATAPPSSSSTGSTGSSGMIVVPTPPASSHPSAAGDDRRASALRGGPAAAVRREGPGHPARGAFARGKARREVGIAARGAPASDPSAPAIEPAPPEGAGEGASAATGPGAVRAEAPGGKSASGVLHKIRTTSIPSEAEVALDGKVVGRTPLFGTEIDISQAHTLTIRKDGYAPYEQVITASSPWVLRASDNAAALRVAAVLKKMDRVVPITPRADTRAAVNPPVSATASPAVLAATSYKLRITSIPSEAEVWLDGKSLGRTPLFGAAIDMSRPHRLVIRKEGYVPYEQAVTATSDWSIKPSDRSEALLRISALLRQGDSLAQSPGSVP